MSNYSGLSVLLTGAIDISSTPLAIKVSRKHRIKEYLNSIFYMLKKHPSLKFIYVDSSNFNLMKENKEFKKFKNFESIAFQGQEIVKQKGKGAGELESIKYALKNSDFLLNSKYILKLNGRYILKNLDSMIKNINFIKTEPIILGEFRHYHNWFDSRCFLAQKLFYRDLINFEINDFSGIYFEIILARNVNQYLASSKAKWQMFQRKPKFIGTAGDKGHGLRSNKIRSIIVDFIYRLKNKLVSL